jgi:hypothetical protein
MKVTWRCVSRKSKSECKAIVYESASSEFTQHKAHNCNTKLGVEFQYSSGPRSGTSCARGEPSHFAGLSHLVALHKNNTRRVRQLGGFQLGGLGTAPLVH